MEEIVAAMDPPEARTDTRVDPEFERLFCREFPALVRTAYGIVGDWEVARELAADGFVALLRHWSKVRSYDRPGAWLRRVVIRDATRVRRRSPKAPPSPREHASDGSDGSDASDAMVVRAAVLQLPARQRAAVVLHYLDDLSVSEVAAVLGCTEGTVKTHLSRARHALAVALGELTGEELDDVDR
jgi:RNA polymerase sigma-70 factor (ECF subfamily)